MTEPPLLGVSGSLDSSDKFEIGDLGTELGECPRVEGDVDLGGGEGVLGFGADGMIFSCIGDEWGLDRAGVGILRGGDIGRGGDFILGIDLGRSENFCRDGDFWRPGDFCPCGDDLGLAGVFGLGGDICLGGGDAGMGGVNFLGGDFFLGGVFGRGGVDGFCIGGDFGRGGDLWRGGDFGRGGDFWRGDDLTLIGELGDNGGLSMGWNFAMYGFDDGIAAFVSVGGGGGSGLMTLQFKMNQS